MKLRERWNGILDHYRSYQLTHPGLSQFIKFCLVGFSGFLVDMGTVITIKTLFQSDTRLCAVAGFSLAVTTNFILNRYWTFEEGRQSPFFRRYLVFVAVCCIGMSARLGVMHLLIVYSTIDTGYGYILVNFIGIVVATAINFFGSKFFAFST